MRGRPRVPTAILKARGSWRADTLGRGNEPKFEGLPQKPEYLTPLACVEWDRVIAELGPSRVASRADQASLAAYCEAVAEFVAACQALAECQTKKIMHLVARKRSAIELLFKAAAHFGLTPSTRSRVGASEDKDAGSSSKARFFKAS